MFRDSSTQLYVPAFTQKDFHYSVHTGLLTQGTSTEDLGNTNWKYTTPLSTNSTSTQEARHNTNHLYTQRDNHNPMHNLLYAQRARHKATSKWMNTTLGGFNKPQTNFSPKTKILQIGQIDSSSVRKIKSLEIKNTKKNSWENFQNSYRNEDQKPIPKTSHFLDFFNPLKTNKE